MSPSDPSRKLSTSHSNGVITMTAPHIVDPAGVLSEALLDASPDLMRSLLQTMINALLSADADAVVGAAWGQPRHDRTTPRHAYRHRAPHTRHGHFHPPLPNLPRAPHLP